MPIHFHLTVTINFADGSEMNDLDIADTVPAADIGSTAWDAAVAAAIERGTEVTSLVIVAVVA